MREATARVREITYWASPGPTQTDGTIELALARAAELGIDRVVVASNTGDTARRVRARAPAATRVVCVTHQVGFNQPGEDELGDAARRELRDAGVEVFTGTHFFAGVDRALRRAHSGLHPAEIVAQTLRLLGQGAKVAVEIAVMATDAGLVPPDREVVSIGGTGRGADTALVLRPAHGQDFFSTKIVEIICMPR